MKGAEALNIPSNECIVFEDAVAGIEAAHRAGMKAVGIGQAKVLTQADTFWPLLPT
ncbi:MAG: HAD-IA family hydrolase [Spirosomataceae bacterium]